MLLATLKVVHQVGLRDEPPTAKRTHKGLLPSMELFMTKCVSSPLKRLVTERALEDFGLFSAS